MTTSNRRYKIYLCVFVFFCVAFWVGFALVFVFFKKHTYVDTCWTERSCIPTVNAVVYKSCVKALPGVDISKQEIKCWVKTELCRKKRENCKIRMEEQTYKKYQDGVIVMLVFFPIFGTLFLILAAATFADLMCE
jgi:hypothetical protein